MMLNRDTQAVMTETQAGAELDMLVAEQVLGLVSCDRWQVGALSPLGEPSWRKACDHPYGTCYPHGRPMPYSRDLPSLMWVLVEMEKQGWDWRIGSDIEESVVSPQRYWCELERGDESGDVEVIQHGDTVMVAACRAALAAARLRQLR